MDWHVAHPRFRANERVGNLDRQAATLADDRMTRRLGCDKLRLKGANPRETTMSGNSAYLEGLGKTQANHAPLTPLGFIERAAYVYPDKLAVVHGPQRFTWKETYARCRRLASALSQLGIGKNDTVAVMLPNTPPMYEAHFGVPMCAGRC